MHGRAREADMQTRIDVVRKFVVAGVAGLLCLAPWTPARAHNGVTLSAFGAATVDGEFGEGEWDGAAATEMTGFLPAVLGGDAATATLRVKNDGTNLYACIRYEGPDLPFFLVRLNFDEDHDEAFGELGEDIWVVTKSPWFGLTDYANVNDLGHTAQDASVGGTNDGSGAWSYDGTWWTIELSHPLDSADDAHDIDAVPGMTFGMRAFLTLYAVTPITGAGDTSNLNSGALDVVVAIPPVVQADVVFEDGDFAAADWTTEVLEQQNGGSLTASVIATGGNPGAYRSVRHVIETGPGAPAPLSRVLSLHWRAGAVFDPSATGPVGTVDYSEDDLVIGGGQGTGIALRQDGKTFIAAIGTLGANVIEKAEWTNRCRIGFVASDFRVLTVSDGLITASAAEQPDFSATATPLQFGFFRDNTAAASGNGSTTTCGIDNWRVRVARQPSFVFSDEEFAPADWTTQVVHATNGATQSMNRVSSGGDPGAYRWMSHTLPAAPGGTSTRLWVFHRYLAGTVDPSLTPVAEVDYAEDAVLLATGWAVGSRAALLQDGVVYVGPSSLVVTNLLWRPFCSAKLTAADFTDVESVVGLGTARHPDFSRTGTPISFGYLRHNGTSSTSQVYIPHGIDGWRVVVRCVDSVAPTVLINAPATGDVIGAASVAVSATVADSNPTTVTSVPAGLTATLPQGGGTASGTVPLDVEGTNFITVSARDALGNVGGTSIEVVRDTTAPAVTVVSPADGAVAGESPVTLTVSVTDLTATTLRIGEATRALPAGGGTVSVDVPLVGGSNVITVCVTDAAGNETQVARSVVLDLDAPIVRIDSPVGGARIGPGGSPVAVLAHVEDLTATEVDSTPAGVVGSLPAGGGVVVGALDLVEGDNAITVRATDAFGQSGSASVTVVYDTTAPVAAFACPLAGSVLSGAADLQVAADDPLPGSGVVRVDVLLDGALLQTFTEAPWYALFDTSALSDGTHVLSVTATDGLGNTSDPVSIDVVIDNTPPVVTIVRPFSGALIGGTVPFEVEATDATGGIVAVSMEVAGDAPTGDASATYATPLPATTVTGSDDTTRWPDGGLTFSASARDAAGNVSTVTVTAETDNTAPAKSLVSPRGGDVVSGVFTVEAAAEDPHLASITILIDGVEVASSASSPLTVPVDSRTRLDGAMTIEVRTADTAGNVSACMASVTVGNIRLRLLPTMVSLRGRGDVAVRAELSGPNLSLLVPGTGHTAELRIPGGNPVPAVEGWDWLATARQDGVVVRMLIAFDRALLVASIRAGIAAGEISNVNVGRFEATLVIDGLEQGVIFVGFSGAK